MITDYIIHKIITDYITSHRQIGRWTEIQWTKQGKAIQDKAKRYKIRQGKTEWTRQDSTQAEADSQTLTHQLLVDHPYRSKTL
jgi:hypothetical protein